MYLGFGLYSGIARIKDWEITFIKNITVTWNAQKEEHAMQGHMGKCQGQSALEQITESKAPRKEASEQTKGWLI